MFANMRLCMFFTFLFIQSCGDSLFLTHRLLSHQCTHVELLSLHLICLPFHWPPSFWAVHHLYNGNNLNAFLSHDKLDTQKVPQYRFHSYFHCSCFSISPSYWPCDQRMCLSSNYSSLQTLRACHLLSF